MATTETTRSPYGALKWIAFVGALLAVYFLLRSCFDAPTTPVASDSTAAEHGAAAGAAGHDAAPAPDAAAAGHDTGAHDAAAGAQAPQPTGAAAVGGAAETPPASAPATPAPARDSGPGAMGGRGPAGK